MDLFWQFCWHRAPTTSDHEHGGNTLGKNVVLRNLSRLAALTVSILLLSMLNAPPTHAQFDFMSGNTKYDALVVALIVMAAAIVISLVVAIIVGAHRSHEGEKFSEEMRAFARLENATADLNEALFPDVGRWSSA